MLKADPCQRFSGKSSFVSVRGMTQNRLMLNFLSGLTAGSCLFLIWHLLRSRPKLTPLPFTADRKFRVVNDWRGGIGRDVKGKEYGR